MSQKKRERDQLRLEYDRATTEAQRDHIFQKIKDLDRKYREKRKAERKL